MTKDERKNISIYHRQIQQSLDYIHSDRINEGRLIIETIERDLGKLLSPAKLGKGKVK